MSIENIFPITDDDIKKVRSFYNKTEQDIQEEIAILRRWLEKQGHLPEKHEDERLERFLLRNKFRIELCKKKLDNYYTLRGLHSDCFRDVDPNSELMLNVRKAIVWSPMPKLTPNMERVFIFRLNVENHLYVYQHCMTYILSVLDIQLSHDYAIGDRIVYDLQGYNLNHFKTIDINVLSKTLSLHQEAFSGRLTGLDFINTPPFMHKITNLLKMFFKPKLFKKIAIHKDLQSLHKRVPKECLPKEYGGDQALASSIHENLGLLTELKRDFIMKHAGRVADESLRIGDMRQNDIFGMNGTFKKINID